MPIASPETYSQMLDRAKVGKFAYPAIEKFLKSYSRTYSLTPLYKEMIKTPTGKVWAKQIFNNVRWGQGHTVYPSPLEGEGWGEVERSPQTAPE